MLTSLLGLAPEGFDHRLRVVRPVLPPTIRGVTLRQLRVGRGSVDLTFERRQDGGLSVHVLRNEGDIDVRVEGA
jgi:hypothetical protein